MKVQDARRMPRRVQAPNSQTPIEGCWRAGRLRHFRVFYQMACGSLTLPAASRLSAWRLERSLCAPAPFDHGSPVLARFETFKLGPSHCPGMEYRGDWSWAMLPLPLWPKRPKSTPPRQSAPIVLRKLTIDCIFRS